MFLGLQTYSVTNVTISGVGGGVGAQILTPFAAMFDARSGTVTSFQWGAGTQNTSSYVQLVFTITSPFGGTPRLGIIHIANVIGLPEGTLFDVQAGTYTQRLVAGRRDELNAIIIPTSVLNTGSLTLRIYNDVNGTSPIVSNQVFAIGEVLFAPLINIPTLIDDEPPSEVPFDPTAWERSDGLQLWQVMRKPVGELTVKSGRFSMTDAMGGAAYSTINNGLPAGFGGKNLDIKGLAYKLATCGMLSFIDIPHKGFRDRSNIQAAGGGYFDATMVQTNAILCRPMLMKPVSMDKFPYWAFSLDMQEST